MEETQKLGYISHNIGENYLTIINRGDKWIIALVKLIGVEFDTKLKTVSYTFKTATGKYLYRDWGDFYTMKNQEQAELKWKKLCLAKREKE